MITALYRWFDRTVLELGRELHLSYLPPLMVYLAAGVSGITGIVGTFFVKEYLGLSAEFLAALGFWMMIPWALKMPLGHLVDLIWRYKALLVYLGAGLIALSLFIMIGLLSDREAMQSVMSVNSWFVLSALLAPIGYVVQDVVADAMTIEAVPRVDENGQEYDAKTKKLMHTTMQTLGRAAIVGGGIFVAALNIMMFSGVQTMGEAEKIAVYTDIYLLALCIPVISVIGVGLGGVLRQREYRRLISTGMDKAKAKDMVRGQTETPKANKFILGGSLIFVIFTLVMGLGDFPFNQEIIFLGSMGIVVFLMYRLMLELTPEARATLLGTAIVIFVFRATPTPGAGSTWWMIDELGFDQQFLSILSLIASCLALFGMFIFRRFMAEKPIAYVIVFLTIVTTILSLPIIGMYYGLHQWTSAHTGGVVDARFIAVVDTALESPLGQVAMIPMLAWIANSAPAKLKATFFAVMASFSNLALSLSQLGTKYVNQIFTVTRELTDPKSGEISVPADYSEFGILLITVTCLAFILPMLAIVIVRWIKLKSA